jgi:hypothetical protein
MTALATVEELEHFLQQSLSEYEVEAEQALALASAAVRSHCRRTFDYVEDDEITLPWQPRIFLPNPPVASISTVELDGTEVSYQRDQSGGIYPPDATTESTVRVIYTHGFTDLPEEVRLVVLRLASRIFKNPTGRVSFQADSLNYQGMGDVAPRILTGDEAAILKRWRLHRLVSL